MQRIEHRFTAMGGPCAIRVDCDDEGAAALCAALPEAWHDPRARLVALCGPDGPGDLDGHGDEGPDGVLVLSAGTSDGPVAREALVTARMLGAPARHIPDVGVAGIHRLFAHTAELRSAAVVIVVAGMEGALPSVVGGLVDRPVIGVPTSVGYGTGADGVAALLSMLNSCASGITVVNVDNGFGAGYAAATIHRLKGASAE